LRRWLHANVRLVATKKGMVTALPSRPIVLLTFTPIPRIASRRPSDRCSTALPRPVRSAPTSRLRTSCARSWACPTTSTTPPIGERRRCDLSTSS
jgi:hypothetical protein